MKTTMMAGVCLLALVLTFTIAECGASQEKRQATSCDEILKSCITGCERTGGSDATVTRCKEICRTYGTCSLSDGDGSDGDGDDDEGSGATAIAGATIFSTISALLVAVASAMN